MTDFQIPPPPGKRDETASYRVSLDEEAAILVAALAGGWTEVSAWERECAIWEAERVALHISRAELVAKSIETLTEKGQPRDLCRKFRARGDDLRMFREAASRVSEFLVQPCNANSFVRAAVLMRTEKVRRDG